MAFKRWNKSPSKQPPKKTWTAEEMKIIGWCLTHAKIGVSISPDWKSGVNNWNIDIHIKNKVHRDPGTYKDHDVYDKLVEYYKYYYDKYNRTRN
tara:strand:- start:341 stop:622 length:282 start_codon:yes stop_codon:yes gene_type:complete